MRLDKLKNRCNVKECLIIFLIYIFVYQTSLKQTFNTGFRVQNHILVLFSRVVNSQIVIL